MRYITLIFLTGCLTQSYSVSGAEEQADLLITTYEREYSSELSDKEVECVHNFNLNYRSHRHVRQICEAPFSVVGCMYYRRSPADLYLSQALSPEREKYTIRHELTHLLLWCHTGYAAENHQVPEFGFSGTVDAVGSLARDMDL